VAERRVGTHGVAWPLLLSIFGSVARSGPLYIQHETAELLRRVLALVEAGELSAESSQAKRLLRRIEGAAAALDPGHQSSDWGG